MKLTNKLRLPSLMVSAVGNDTYTKGDADFSVTELLTPPQLRRLRIDHFEEIEEDVADRIWSLLGSSTHHMIERAGLQSLASLNEVTVMADYDGFKIKGQADHVALDEGTLYDFKVTSVRKVRDNIPAPEWIEQTNIYRRLLEREVGLVINSVAVIAILRDWSKNEASRTSGYPQAQVVRLDIPLWTDDQTDAFVQERIALHTASEPRPCTDADRWVKPSKYAVMKRGAQRAVRLFDTAQEAEELASSSAAMYVEYRPGEAVRCQNWCPVSRWCTQWQADPRNTTQTQSTTESLFDAKV